MNCECRENLKQPSSTKKVVFRETVAVYKKDCVASFHEWIKTRADDPGGISNMMLCSLPSILVLIVRIFRRAQDLTCFAVCSLRKCCNSDNDSVLFIELGSKLVV